MAIEVYPNIYLQEVVLPNNPLKSINSFFVISEDQCLMVDTGFNNEASMTALKEGMAQFNRSFNQIDLFLTHLHADHCGLAGVFQRNGAKIYASEKDGNAINEMQQAAYWEHYEALAGQMDLKRDQITFVDHPAIKYVADQSIDFIPLVQGDELKVGSYTFQVLEVPGHTPGHLALYERDHGLLFGGDHILDKITPNITFWDFNINSLGDYLESLKRISYLPIKVVFTGHRNLVHDAQGRIIQLLGHYGERLIEVMNILDQGKATVRDVASQMHWSIRAYGWGDFPSPQKWFAAGEAMSHLEYLVHGGKAKRTLEDGKLYYKRL